MGGVLHFHLVKIISYYYFLKLMEMGFFTLGLHWKVRQCICIKVLYKALEL